MALSVAVLRNIDFRRLMLARVLGNFGLQAQAVIVGWQIYTLTHDVFMLGLVGLTEAVPAIVCALFSGHLVDVHRPHPIYCAAIGVLALNMVTLLLIGGGIVPVESTHQVYVIFGCVFLSGIARSFITPSSFTLLSRIVPRHDIPAASAWVTSGLHMAAVVGPAVAGLIYGGYGPRVAWLMPVSMLSAAFVIAVTISKPYRQYKSAEIREPAIASIKTGWRFILGNRVLLSVMALDMFAVLFGGAVAMLPAFADTVLHVGSQGLGLLRAATAVGSITTGLYLAFYPMKKIRARLLLWVIAGFGLSIMGFGLSQTFWLAALCLALSGAFDGVSMVIREALMQLQIPDAMRGRVSAVNGMFIISSNEIGAFESGAAASLLGLVPSIVIGGAVSIAVAGIAALIAPQLRKLVVTAEEIGK